MNFMELVHVLQQWNLFMVGWLPSISVDGNHNWLWMVRCQSTCDNCCTWTSQMVGDLPNCLGGVHKVVYVLYHFYWCFRLAIGLWVRYPHSITILWKYGLTIFHQSHLTYAHFRGLCSTQWIHVISMCLDAKGKIHSWSVKLTRWWN